MRESPAVTLLTTGSGEEKERGELEGETESDGLGWANTPSGYCFDFALLGHKGPINPNSQPKSFRACFNNWKKDQNAPEFK